MNTHELHPPADLIPLGPAASILHVTPSTLWRWVVRGKLRSWKRAGTRYLVSRADVLELLQPVHTRTRDVSSKGEREREREARQKHTQEILRQHGLA
jgi:excisionase family DNA binding protein